MGVKNIRAFCSGKSGRSAKIMENLEMLPLSGKTQLYEECRQIIPENLSVGCHSKGWMFCRSCVNKKCWVESERSDLWWPFVRFRSTSYCCLKHLDMRRV